MLSKVHLSILLYSLCSGSLLLLNKICVHLIPLPSGITIIQLVAAVFIVYILKFMDFTKVDDFQWAKMKPYMVYTCSFVGGVYANMRSLQISNVETVIVFRAMTPIVVSFLETLFLGRKAPSTRSFGALILIAVGAMAYVATDKEFGLNGIESYFWPFTYLGMIAFEMTYGKKIVKEVELELGGSVLYTNALSILPMSTLYFLTHEGSNNPEGLQWTMLGIAMLCISCVVGAGIGFSGWWCRSLVSATSYTLIGVINKVFTILVNLLIWDNHASSSGIAALSLCLVGGALYRQSPMATATVYAKITNQPELTNKV